MSHHRQAPDDVDRSPAAAASSFRSPAALARLLLTAGAGLALDLATKVWAFNALAYNRVTYPDGSSQVQSHTYFFIPGWLHFHVTGNHGAVFGMGQGNRWWFVGVSVMAIGFLFYLFGTSRPRQKVYQLIVGMLLAGVLGNLYDRVVYGYVRDMIYMLPGRTWPAWLADRLPADWEWTRGPVFPWIFNVADTLLCTGVALMLVYSVVMQRRHQHEREASADAGATAAPAKS
jgi:signal peptidase II